MDNREALTDIFEIFHDGVIEKIDSMGDELSLKVGITYLAELMNESFDSITLLLKDVSMLEYHAWSDDDMIVRDISEIEKLEAEILNTVDADSGSVEIATLCRDEKKRFTGGNLIIGCAGYQLFDEAGKEISLDYLKKVSTYYWDEVFGRS